MEDRISNPDQDSRKTVDGIAILILEGVCKNALQPENGGISREKIEQIVRAQYPVKKEAIMKIVKSLAARGYVSTDPWCLRLYQTVCGFEVVAAKIIPDYEDLRGKVKAALKFGLSAKTLAGAEDTYSFYVYKWILLSFAEDGLIEVGETSGGGGNVIVRKINPIVELQELKKSDFYRPM